MGIFDLLKKIKNIENDNGLNETYYNNGRSSIEKRFFLKNGKQDGLCKNYYESGQLESEENYVTLAIKKI